MLFSGFKGRDYPRLWPIREPGPVRMFVEGTVHYGMEGAESDLQWDALTPGDGIIYLGDDQPFSISMFHQLRCVNIIRREVIKVHQTNATAAPSTLSRHCLNYLRQMLLCNPNMHLDPLLGSRRNAHANAYMCRDWDAVYQEVRDNQRRHYQRHLKVGTTISLFKR